jgi:uncharacterized membrane protein
MILYTAQKRSFLKSITFRITVITSDAIIIYALTRRIDLTAGLVIITNCSSTVLYFVHERIWNRIQWGRVQMRKGQ